MLGDLSAAFEPLSPVTFRFDRLETNPRFATIVRPGNAAGGVVNCVDAVLSDTEPLPWYDHRAIMPCKINPWDFAISTFVPWYV